MEQNIKKPILSVEDLEVKYITRDEVVSAVNGVSFNINYGEALGLVGETGAGKTTIAKSIMRILPDPPAKIVNGKIILDEKDDLVTFNNEQMRKIRGRRISMVFQDPMTALNPVVRVGRQVAEGIKIHENISWGKAEEKAKKMLELVGIGADRFREYPHQFSGGMKQRVIIAIALACSPDLLIADEPTTALDVTIQAQVLEMVRELQKERNTAMILISHDLAVVSETCDNIGVVYAGEIIEYGTILQVFRDPRHPYTQGLFAAIPTMTTDLDRLRPILGAPPDPTHLPPGCHFHVRCPHATEECRKPIDTVTLPDGHKYRCNMYDRAEKK